MKLVPITGKPLDQDDFLTDMMILNEVGETPNDIFRLVCEFQISFELFASNIKIFEDFDRNIDLLKKNVSEEMKIGLDLSRNRKIFSISIEKEQSNDGSRTTQ